jgi:subtilisin family serine protease
MPMGRGRRTFEPAANLLAVTYDENALAGTRTAVAAREQRGGMSLVREFDYANTHVATRIVRVTSGTLAAAQAALQGTPGVKSIGRTGYRIPALSVTTPYFPNDPYFRGFSINAPLYESAAVPGQWDKHVERLEDAFAYSQMGNGSGIVNASALGSSNIKIAIIDTGEDTTHPELASKIVYTKCFISDPNNVQSSSNFETDPQGHGTDVAGIAAADSNNALGFSGSGGNAVIYGYRVFPTPDDNCTSDTTTDDQCAASTTDIASAIVDATAQHVNVISMSLGGGGGSANAACTNGQDPDPNEAAAVANAIAAGIVIVASSGNDGGSPIAAPACDTGVIAAGATSIADGQPNGFGNSNGSSSAPNEYVASYSDYDTTGTTVNSPNAWGIVAPGGDPVSDNDQDDLHWVLNIWTNTPFDSNFSADGTSTCETTDYNSVSNQVDCQVFIAGTSMAAPNVAGAAALILSVNSSYQSASAMKTLLCETADDIQDSHEGCGRLDIYRAMAKALNDPSPPNARAVP